MGGAPAQFSDLPPGDTAAVVAMIRQTMRDIDASLAQMTEHDTTLAAVADSQPRRVSVWLDNNVVRKLVVTDSGGNGPGAGETEIWFVGGDVAVVQQVSDVYALDDGRIVLWTDEALQPRDDVTSAMLMTKQQALMEFAREWLAIVGITLQQ
jgi:hypothetical protein